MKPTIGDWKIVRNPFLAIESNGQLICQISKIEVDENLDILSKDYFKEQKRCKSEELSNALLIASSKTLLKVLQDILSLENNYGKFMFVKGSKIHEQILQAINKTQITI